EPGILPPDVAGLLLRLDGEGGIAILRRDDLAELVGRDQGLPWLLNVHLGRLEPERNLRIGRREHQAADLPGLRRRELHALELWPGGAGGHHAGDEVDGIEEGAAVANAF